MKRIPKQEYTAAFKEQAVAMVKGGKTAAEAARALGLVEQTFAQLGQARRQGQAAHWGQGHYPEQMELSRLRAENSRLKLEVEILKKATAYFAKDAL